MSPPLLLVPNCPSCHLKVATSALAMACATQPWSDPVPGAAYSGRSVSALLSLAFQRDNLSGLLRFGGLLRALSTSVAKVPAESVPTEVSPLGSRKCDPLWQQQNGACASFALLHPGKGACQCQVYKEPHLF